MPLRQEEMGLGDKAKEPEWPWAAERVLGNLRAGQVSGIYGAAWGPGGPDTHMPCFLSWDHTCSPSSATEEGVDPKARLAPAMVPILYSFGRQITSLGLSMEAEPIQQR